MIAEIADKAGEIFEMLVDGRNRRAACKIAGVTPEVRRLNGEDPTDFVYSGNIQRRHLQAGQRHLAIALLYPENDAKGGRGKKGFAAKHFADVTKAGLSKARTVIRFAPELIPNVMSSAISLDKAYETALARKAAAESEDAKMAELREEAPDLSELVVEGRMALSDALAALHDRQGKIRQKIEAGENAARTALLVFASHVGSIMDAVELGAAIDFDANHIKLYRNAVEKLNTVIKKGK